AKYREQQALKQERGEIRKKKVSKKNGFTEDTMDQEDEGEEDLDSGMKKEEEDFLEYPVDDTDSKDQPKSHFEES
ncbi:hypothetical protein WICPIJ_003460, partial [Wickerhamomyces pijperi]